MNLGDGSFDDRTYQAGLGINTRLLGWGVSFIESTTMAGSTFSSPMATYIPRLTGPRWMLPTPSASISIAICATANMRI